MEGGRNHRGNAMVDHIQPAGKHTKNFLWITYPPFSDIRIVLKTEFRGFLRLLRPLTGQEVNGGVIKNS